MVDRTVAELGGLDVAVNNVGSLAGRSPGLFLDLDDDALRDIVEQNLFVTMWSCQAEARVMVAAATAGRDRERELGGDDPSRRAHGALRRGQGRRSTTSPRPWPSSSHRTASACSRSRPARRSRRWSRAALSDDTVEQLVAAHPLGRLGEPDDLGRLVVALASDLGRSVTGQLVFGDNGAQLARNRPWL